MTGWDFGADSVGISFRVFSGQAALGWRDHRIDGDLFGTNLEKTLPRFADNTAKWIGFRGGGLYDRFRDPLERRARLLRRVTDSNSGPFLRQTYETCKELISGPPGESQNLLFLKHQHSSRPICPIATVSGGDRPPSALVQRLRCRRRGLGDA